VPLIYTDPRLKQVSHNTTHNASRLSVITSTRASVRDISTVCLLHPPFCARNNACSRSRIKHLRLREFFFPEN